MSDINKDKLKAYRKILSVLNKSFEVIESDRQIDIRSTVESRIQSIEVYELFNIDLIRPAQSGGGTYYKISDYGSLSKYGEEYRRTISWSDDGSQPENEWLYQISFSTGAYIFGDEYPEKAFRQFFDELKTYCPKYSDTNNKSLYFAPENAKVIHEAFDSILEKYRAVANKEIIEKRINDAEAKLEKLKAIAV